MKSDAAAKSFATLLKKILRQYNPEEALPCDPVTQLVIAYLQWGATRKQAESAFADIMEVMVDINELRVSHPREIIAVLGDDYPEVHERIDRLREALQEVFVREYAVAMKSMENKGKKEQRAYLDSIPGMVPYVAASVTLISHGGHALPVDEKLVALLANEGVCEPDASPAELESFLLRQVKASDTLDAHLALQAWSDARKMPSKVTRKTAAKTTAAKKAPAKTTKKKTTKKKVAKRSKKK